MPGASLEQCTPGGWIHAERARRIATQPSPRFPGATNMAGNVTEFTDQNFQNEVLQAGVPVLVDFWAPWCGPCRMLGPLIEQLAAENQGAAEIGKLNVDDSPDAAQ